MSERSNMLGVLKDEISLLERLIEKNKIKLGKKPDNYWQIESIIKKQEEMYTKLLKRRVLSSF